MFQDTLNNFLLTSAQKQEKQLEIFLELLIDKNLETQEIIEQIAAGKNDSTSLIDFKEQVEEISNYALENKLVEKNGLRFSLSKLGERFLFSSKIYAR